MRGGIKSAYDTPIRLKVYRVDDTFVNNYTKVEQNRGNRIDLQYNVSQKKVINDEGEAEKKNLLKLQRAVSLSISKVNCFELVG